MLDANDVVLMETSATASTNRVPAGEHIPFAASIRFPLPETRAGTLIVEKANPSGASQLSDQVRIPVLF